MTEGAEYNHPMPKFFTAWILLVLSLTGAFIPVLALSMAFSVVGVLVILRLESSARVLIPHWEESLPPEARSMGSSGVHPTIPNVPPNDLAAARSGHSLPPRLQAPGEALHP